MRYRGMTIFWPQYFDRRRSVNQGRRVPIREATDSPEIQDLVKAAQKLKYQVEIESTAKYPKSTWDEPGLVLIDTMGQKKTFVLHKLAPEIRAMQMKRKDMAKLEKVKKKNRDKSKKEALLRQKIIEHEVKKKKKN